MTWQGLKTKMSQICSLMLFLNGCKSPSKRNQRALKYALGKPLRSGLMPVLVRRICVWKRPKQHIEKRLFGESIALWQGLAGVYQAKLRVKFWTLTRQIIKEKTSLGMVGSTPANPCQIPLWWSLKKCQMALQADWRTLTTRRMFQKRGD